jgi:SAM-dependent methyltransferase
VPEGDGARAYRTSSLERWSRAATGWGTHREQMQAAFRPVSGWLVDAIEPQPGHRVLELAAGPGDTGFLAAELIAPGGTLVTSDAVEEMLALARARAHELGIQNVEFQIIDAEWIDLPTASLDGVLARWGYMLLADPAAALRETRRVLRPGGRVALAAWTDPDENPWTAVAMAEARRIAGGEPPDLDAPNMFAFRDPGTIRGLLEDTGFTDIVVAQVDLVFRYPDLDTWWDTVLDISTTLGDAVTALTPAQRDDLRDAIDARLAKYVASA